MRTQSCVELRDRQMKELNEFPIAYTFDEKYLFTVVTRTEITEAEDRYRFKRTYEQIFEELNISR